MNYASKFKKTFLEIDGRYYAALFAVLIALYLLYTILNPPSKAVLSLYHLSHAHAEWIIYSVVIPLIAIWSAGMFGAYRLKRYAYIIKDSPDGEALNLLSTGLIIFVVALPLASDLSSLVALVTKHHLSWLPTLSIINTYVDILLMAAGLVWIAAGADKLAELIHKKIGPLEKRIWMLGFIILSSFYSYFLVSQPSGSAKTRQQYFMPQWLVILTIAIPYLYFWYRGFSGAYRLYVYQSRIKGHIYKASLIYIAAGIAVSVVSSIFVRILSTVSFHLSRLNLTPILFIIYGFLVLSGIGYLLIAWGAKKLRKIEEV